ncbi:MAG: glycosyltransferase family 2 protein [Actinomycetota bacterium]
MKPRIAVVVVAYNAQETLEHVLDRIPSDFVSQITAVIVCDDASTDLTHEIVLNYQRQSTLPITVIRHSENLGYGGNQKFGYDWAIRNSIDFVVLLHGDGQYAPEFLPQMLQPLLNNDADIVFGSRMMARGSARHGGMPLYKFVGNKILTRSQNFLARVNLSEWHSGYRAYRVASLMGVKFHSNSNAFDFDTQIILQMIESRQRITEIPIPTFYGEEISRVNSVKYGLQILGHTIRYRFKRHRAPSV